MPTDSDKVSFHSRHQLTLTTKQNMASGTNLRKALFRSPDEDVKDSGKSSELVESLLNKVQVDIEVDSNLSGLTKEIHEQRLDSLRQELEAIGQDQWKYKPVEQIIGF